jgi:hypothetical protein|tara:strand:+ start:109 stop:1986 length:1878 start_codon:yes stop_codon:yes gene_type:complete
MSKYTEMLLNIIKPTTERQYGGGLDDAYMNRRSAFAAPDANSAFTSPMVYREQGGLTSIPKERMINDQPHQLSYINPQEAGLLQALGGSGRKVDGVPSYFWSDDTGDGGYTDDGDDGNYNGPSYSDDGIGDDLIEGGKADEDYAWNYNPSGGYDYTQDPLTVGSPSDTGYTGKDGTPTLSEYFVDRFEPELGGQLASAYADPSEPGGVGTTKAVADLLRQDVYGTQGLEWLKAAQGLRKGDNFGFEKGNVGQAQRAIDRDLLNRGGVPLAQALENMGLATFGKGMRGPFEAYTPGDALYRYEDEDSLAAGRGVYEPSLLTGTLDEDVSPAARELDMRMRYAKEGETVADVTAQMVEQTNLSPEEISQAALDFGYSTNSTAQASQVYESLNDARGKGMLSGLGIIAGGAISPGGFVHSMLSDYDKDGNVSSPMGKAFNSFAESTGIKGVADKLGIGGDSKTLDAAGNVIDFLQRGPGSIEVEPARTGVPSMVPVDEGYRGINSEDGFGSKEASTKSSESSETSFGDSVSKFLTNIFGSGDGMITQPLDPIDYGNEPSPPKKIRRRQQDQSQQVAVILKAVAETPVEVKRSIEERGLTPQYLALLQAGLTSEEAIKAIGAPAGTALT